MGVVMTKQPQYYNTTLYVEQRPSQNFHTKMSKVQVVLLIIATNREAKSCMEGGGPLRQRTILSYITLLC